MKLWLSIGLGTKTCPGIFQLGQPTQIIWTRVLLLIRLSDIDSICRKIYCCNFFTRLLSYTSTPRSCRKSNVYHRCIRSILPLSIFSTPTQIFTSVKNVKFGLDLRHHSSLSGSHFETKQCVATKISYLVQRWWNSVLPKSGAVWPTPSDE